MSAFDKAILNIPDDLMFDINESIFVAVEKELSRREVIKKGLLAGGLICFNLMATGCSTDDESVPNNQPFEDGPDGNITLAGGLKVNGQSFYEDISLVKKQTPITASPEDDQVAFKKQATVRGKAVGVVIGFWLKVNPYGMFDELFEMRDSNPVFQPGIGPVIVFQHPHVIDVFERFNDFTVDPYAPAMELATSGHFFSAKEEKTPGGTNESGFYNHYMLGTDNDQLYIPDSLISRHVVKATDAAVLRPMVRRICEDLVKHVKRGMEFDAVTTIARYSPVMVVAQYLGLPSLSLGMKGDGAFDIDGLKGGDSFNIPEAMKQRFHFQKITEGRVPTPADTYHWVVDAFRNIFNNFSRDPKFSESGLIATENLLAWSAKIIEVYKYRIQKKNHQLGSADVPDTMITRLIKLQQDVRNPAKTDDYVKLFNCKDKEELMVRTNDDRVQVNAFGTFVGAVANPEEANARIIDGLLKLKDGQIKAKSGSYQEMRKMALELNSISDDTTAFNKYIIELLRLNPQGEVVVRLCKRNTKVAGVDIRGGTFVFSAHGAAMRDPQVVSDPKMFDGSRDLVRKPYRYDADIRKGEAPQSSIYLHHGYGRHKCLGRYASEITMEEVVRALLRLGDISRAGVLEMDEQNLYAKSLKVRVG